MFYLFFYRSIQLWCYATTSLIIHYIIIFISKNDVLGCITRKWKKIISSKKKIFWKDTYFISGLGGNANIGETPLITAIRETLEEIYEFIEIPKNPKIYKNSKKFIKLKKNLKFPTI